RVLQSLSYDPASRRLTQAQFSTEHSGAPGTWDEKLTENYGYDQSGNMKAINETAAGATVSDQCVNVDYLGRLLDAWTTTSASCQPPPPSAVVGGPAPYWQTYTYALVGNRTTRTDHSPTGGADTVATSHYPAAGGAQPHTVTSIDYTGPSGSHTDTYGYNAAA